MRPDSLVSSCLRIHISHRSWNGAGLQPYLDAAISIILPFADWHYKVQNSLSIGQVITLSLLNGYITFRFYQKTLATESEGQHTLKETVERTYFLHWLFIVDFLNLPSCPNCRCYLFFYRPTLYLVSSRNQSRSSAVTRDQ